MTFAGPATIRPRPFYSGVVIVDPVTGEPIVDFGGGGGGGSAFLASIDTKTPALVSGRQPVTIDPAQITILTPPPQITGFATSANQVATNTRLNSLISQTNRTATFTNRSGTTSGSINQWTELAPANTNRIGFFVQNVSNTTIEIGIGATGSEFRIYSLRPGGEWGIDRVITTQRLAVRCPTEINRTFIGIEANV